MCRELFLVVSFCVFASVFGQGAAPVTTTTPKPVPAPSILSTRTGNFSLEILYHISKVQKLNENLIISPFTIWTALAVIAEGAVGDTFEQIKNATRLPKKVNSMILRNSFKETVKWLNVNTSTINLQQVNTLFADKDHILERDFKELISSTYSTQLIPVNFKDSAKTAGMINRYINHVTRGKITSIVDESSIADSQMILASALYFKGQWASPFNSSTTQRKPFYDANDKIIGEVNMMYNRYNYPFANIRDLQARVIELPYGVENRLSMLIMLPHPNVTLEDMFLNFQKTRLSLNKVFAELKYSQEEYADDEVDCLIPRFKIESDITLNNVLGEMGIYDMFDANLARLPYIARTQLYVTKVIHKAEIEVTEEGTSAAAVTSVEFANRIGVLRFEANKPFAYLIVEKVTNSIVFGGLYQQPSLY